MTEYISRETVLKKLQMQLLDLEADQDKGEYSELCENRGARDALDGAIYDIRTIKAADVQPVKRGRWITKAEDYYKAWQDSGRSWDDMPYFVTGLKFACSNCFEQFDVNAEGVEKWNGCPCCLAKMDGDANNS